MSRRLGDLFAGMNYMPPAWMPIYDLDAVRAKADRECGYASEMMAVRWGQFAELGEFQSMIDIVAAFFPADFESTSHYRLVDMDYLPKIEAILAANTLDQCPSYRGLLNLLLDRGILAKRRDADLQRSSGPS